VRGAFDLPPPPPSSQDFAIGMTAQREEPPGWNPPPVRQEYRVSCVVALAAAVLGKSHSELMPHFAAIPQPEGPAYDPGKHGVGPRDLIKVLRAHGLTYEFHRFNPMNPDHHRHLNRVGTIVNVRRQGRPRGHVYLRTSAGWMDSWINYCEGADVQESKGGYRDSLPLVQSTDVDWIVFPVEY
jgi:hypothetical protein